jgi:hypothetical protein
LDRKIRKLLSILRRDYPEADIDRLYVPRRQGKGVDGVRKSLFSISYELDGLSRQQGRSPNTDYYNLKAQCKLNNIKEI